MSAPYLNDVSPFTFFKRKRRQAWEPGVEQYSYRASFSQPPEGFWKAYFIELEFIGPHGHKLVYTTETNVIPRKLPWNGCWPNQRRKKLYDCTKEYERRFI